MTHDLKAWADWYVSCAGGNVSHEAQLAYDAIDEISRLQAEVERLRKLTLTLSTDRHVPAMRVADEMHKQQAQASYDYMALLSRFDTARNDALEEAAHLIECDGDALGGKSGAAAAIRALKDKP